MKVTIIGQIQNKKTGLGKSINDFIDFCNENATHTITIDITDNKKFFKHCYRILASETEVFYFTPSGSVGGNIRDSFYLLLMILKQKKIVTHFHNSAFGNVVHKYKILQFINKWIYRRINKIIVLGYKSKQMFESLKVPNTKFEVIRNGIDEELFISEEKLIQKQHTQPFNVIYFSNMIKEKGYDIVLEVAKKMQGNPKYHFYFSGKFFDKQLEEAFKKDISGMNNVTYYNGVYGQEKKKLLQEMHYFILPSKEEALPISMLEAMANGLYIIVSNVGVISEVIVPEASHLLNINNSSNDIQIIKILKSTSVVLENIDFKTNEIHEKFSNEKIKAEIFNVLTSL
mgnify:CR=1 FL=1